VTDVGGQVTRLRAPWVSAVTADAVRHFAWGIGDDNPLWHDPDHAAASRWAGVIGPPCLLYAVDEGTVAPGHADRRREVRSVDWTWWDVLREGSIITPTARLRVEAERDGVIEQVGEVEFAGENGRLARLTTTTARVSEPLLPIDDRPEVRYSGEEVADIERRILAESRRGSETRFVDEVEVGALLPEIVKGPLSIMDVVAWCAATQGTASVQDEYSDGGLHDELATGPELVSWMAQVLSDWAGDDGFLHRLEVRLISLPPLGSTTTCSGRVVAVDADAQRVEVGLVATDQASEVSATGTAVVLLPSREHGPVQLPAG